MTKETLEIEEQRVAGYTDLLAAKMITEDRLPIYDGIIDIDSYLASKTKILWVLKEPYDDGENGGGGWSLPEDIKKNCEKEGRASPTLHMVAKVTHSLLNGYKKYDECPFPGRGNEVFRSLYNTGIININKMPSGTVSGDMTEMYNHWKPLLFWQLHVYKPDIVIFGNTYLYFEDDLELRNKKQIVSGTASFVKSDMLYLDVFHPGRKGEDYFREIIQIIKQCND